MDEIADLSQELAAMGRGSLMRRIQQLEAELAQANERIHEQNNQLQAYRTREQLRERKRVLNSL